MTELLRALLAAGRTAGRLTLDLLLPPECPTCEEPVDAPGRLCPNCFRLTSFVTEPCCDKCGVPFAYAAPGGAGRVCRQCEAHPPPWGRARAALLYDEQTRRLVLPFKYADRTDLAAVLAPMMARAGVALLREADLLVPVPLHRRRLLARGYNQAALLAGAMARLTGLAAVPDALRRIRATAPLGGLGVEARSLTVEGAFAVHPRRAALLAGRRVLLIDDVLTSGATCSACVEVLFEAGAAEVDVLVAARVPDPRLR
jgi:ComF family protein